MKQEEYLAAIKKQQSLIRKLFANRKRRSEVIDEITSERYDHLRGKFFKADGEHFKAYKGVTYFIAAVHGDTKADVSDEVVVSLECRFLMRSAVYSGFHIDKDGIEVTKTSPSSRSRSASPLTTTSTTSLRRSTSRRRRPPRRSMRCTMSLSRTS